MRIGCNHLVFCFKATNPRTRTRTRTCTRLTQLHGSTAVRVQRSSDPAIAYKSPKFTELLKSAKQEFSSPSQQHTNFGKFLLTGPWGYIPSKSAIRIAARC